MKTDLVSFKIIYTHTGMERVKTFTSGLENDRKRFTDLDEDGINKSSCQTGRLYMYKIFHVVQRWVYRAICE